MKISVIIWNFLIKQFGFKFNVEQQDRWHFTIIVPKQGTWILKDGYWDDNDIWIDSEIWKDS